MPKEIELEPCQSCGGEVHSSLHKCDPKDFARHNAKKLGERTLRLIGEVLAKHDMGVIEGVIEHVDEISDRLRAANDLLRSAYQVAQRDGAVTNWAAFAQRLEEELVAESKLLNNTPHVPAATCTPKTFRISP